MRLPPGQRRGLALLLALVGVPLLLFALWPWAQDRFGHAAAGEWAVVAVDGQPISEGRTLRIDGRGQVTGGHDGCNAWSFDRDRPGLLTMETEECPEREDDARYWRVAWGGASVDGDIGDRLIDADDVTLWINRRRVHLRRVPG